MSTTNEEAIDLLRAYGRAMRYGDDEKTREARGAVTAFALNLVPEVYTDPSLARASEHLRKATAHLSRTSATLTHIPRQQTKATP